MARFGRPQRSRANTSDSADYPTDEPLGGGYQAQGSSSPRVGASMSSSVHSSLPPTTGGGGGGHRHTLSGSSSGRRSKITSGISTLFRRQPSPDFGPDGFGQANNVGNVGASQNQNNNRGRGKNNRSNNVQQEPTGQYNHQLTPGAADDDQIDANMSNPRTTSSRSLGRNPTSTSYTTTTDDEDGTEVLDNVISGTFSSARTSDEDGYDSSSDSDHARARSRSRSQGRNSSNRRRSRSRSRDPHNMSKPTNEIKLPRRYRGFSTSISSLFLDESLVCGAIACCGILLSTRTEHLLNERDIKRGMTRRGVGGAAGRGKEGGARSPSRILGIAWIITILGVVSTYAIWGFNGVNNNNGGDEWYDEWEDGIDGNDDGQQNNNYGNDDGQNNGYYNDDQANNNQNQGNDDQVNYDQGNDDGAQNQDQGDDAVQNDDGAAAYDDEAQANDDAAMNDDANQRRNLASSLSTSNGPHGLKSYPPDDKDLMSAISPASEEEDVTKIAAKEKHSFIGVMKLRDHKEYIFDPAFGMASQAYSNLMSQFDADEYHPAPPPMEVVDLQQQQSHRQLDSNNTADDPGSQARTVIIVLFLFLLGVIGRRRRMRTRFSILRSRAQDDHLYYASVISRGGGTGPNAASMSIATPDNTVMENFHEREDKYDGACSHTLFGCYPVDSLPADYADYHDNNNNDEEDDDDATAGTTKKRRKGGDFMARTMTTIFNCCCGKICHCWCQLFSMCALAQEARETRLLLPPSMQRIDWITHQPFNEYAKDVNNVRRRFMDRANRTWIQHWAAFSRLSRYILLGFVLCTALVIMTMLVHPNGGFSWGDALVLIATYSQSFLVLFVVFGIFHRSDLSFDAVVKFFAVGFCICVPVGFALEGVIMNGLFSLIYIVYYVFLGIGGESFEYWVASNYRWLSILGELINAYFVAALVEELCKYYGFRFLEHPDLLFLTGLDRTASQAKSSGGLDSYMFDSQLVSDFSKSCEDDGESVDSRGRKKRSSRKLRNKLNYEEEEVEPDIRTLQQQAAAITTGMISVAVGLACAENFLYVFFLGGTGGNMNKIGDELTILLFRSIFPVHALSAAMQSINMIRKFIEEKHGGTKNMGVGRIILPAVMLHGTFDAILMCINAYIEASWEYYYENGGGGDNEDEVPYDVLFANLVCALGIFGVMGLSFGWYSYQNKLQMKRLAIIDMDRSVRSGRGRFAAPNLV